MTLEAYEGNTGSLVVSPAQEVALRIVADHSSFLLQHLHFGDGDRLRDGTVDQKDRETLRGRYIVRVRWDDVKGWNAEPRRQVDHLILYNRLTESCIGWYFHWVR